MRVRTQLDVIPIGKGKLKFHLLKSSHIHMISYERKMINQLRMTHIDDMLQNIYLRIEKGNSYQWRKVIGNSSCSYSDDQIVYYGSFEGLQYHVQIDIQDHLWFIDVLVKGDEKGLVDVFYLQDIGIKDAGAIRNNEAYNSQYIDHKVFEHGNSHAICSLQNGGQKEYLQVGALTPTKGYATDGYQFFGLSYKATNEPEAMQKDRLPNEIYQYEFACAVLQSESFHVSETSNHRVSFYGFYVDHHPYAIKELEYIKEIKDAYLRRDTKPQLLNSLDLDEQALRLDQILTSEPLDETYIQKHYPHRLFEEFKESKRLSFFGKDHEHVVLQAKEFYSERAHGHIILNGQNHTLRDLVMASTSFIFGVFQSQVVLGNTSFTKLISNTRNGLNVQRSNGMRILVKYKDRYQLLGLPALYEMGFNYAKWLYKLEDDVIEVKSYTLMDSEEINLEITSQSDKEYEMIILSQIVMGPDELGNDYEILTHHNEIIIKTVPESFVSTQYPDLTYQMSLISGTLDETDIDGSFLKLFVKGSHITLNILGTHQTLKKQVVSSFELEKEKFIQYTRALTNDFHLSIDQHHPRVQEVSKLNPTMLWYSQNALIHFASPHGLEQFGGAAWGTRDVCQGPFEYFLSLGKYEEAKRILLSVYMHQFDQNGDWPQWFMFDKFFRIQAKESHGDIIVWPLRSVALYLVATHDFEILHVKLPYTDLPSSVLTDHKETLLEHMFKAIDHIKANYIPNTHLSSYGDGDWDDTLQPANGALRKQMVSGWTTALTYETFKMLADVLANTEVEVAKDLTEQAIKIKEDYMKYIVQDGIPAGFLYFGENDEIKYIIHPRDKETNMSYRLLPMNRGIISELFDKPLAENLYQTIKEQLYHPDGVRLMNRTVPYHGGDNTYFKRAETAANFGREIGLQYVHAHIRFIEAMAKLGHQEEAWMGLQQINPIGIKEVVPNAMERQANAYFSSSDGAFLNRYEAMKDFNKLYTGEIPVKGGWRVYSSGPGIYINQVISHLLGVRKEGSDIIIDPQIPKDLDGLTLDYSIDGHKIKLIYHLGSHDHKIYVNTTNIDAKEMASSYRKGGLRFPISALSKQDVNILEYFG